MVKNKKIINDAVVISVTIDGVNTINKFIDSVVNLVEVDYEYSQSKLVAMSIWYSLDGEPKYDNTVTNAQSIRISDEPEILIKYYDEELGGDAIIGTEYVSSEMISQRTPHLDVLSAYNELFNEDEINSIHMIALSRKELEELSDKGFIVVDKVNRTGDGYILEIM